MKYQITEKGINASIDNLYRWDRGENLDDAEVLAAMMVFEPVVKIGAHNQLIDGLGEIAERFVKEQQELKL